MSVIFSVFGGHFQCVLCMNLCPVSFLPSVWRPCSTWGLYSNVSGCVVCIHVVSTDGPSNSSVDWKDRHTPLRLRGSTPLFSGTVVGSVAVCLGRPLGISLARLWAHSEMQPVGALPIIEVTPLWKRLFHLFRGASPVGPHMSPRFWPSTIGSNLLQ
jgi:hypothetical protein